MVDRKNSILGLLITFLILSLSQFGCVSITSNGTAGEPITFMEEGGWCWYQDPRAIIHDGKLIVAGVSGLNGDVKLSVYDLREQKDLGTVVLDPEFERDDHNVPALYARPDGSVLAVWAKHGREKIHYYAISSTDNFLEWGETLKFHHDYEERWGVTYMNLYYLEKEDLLYNFFRDGRTYNPTFITSKDHGKTWGYRTHFIADEVGGRHRPYPRYLQRDENTVGISFTEAHPRNFGNSIYYADFRADSFFKVDGRKIKNLADGPLIPAEAELIYQGSGTKEKAEGFESVPNSAWTIATAVNGKGYPHIGYSLYLSNDDHRYRIASWNGEVWVDREIAFAGDCLYTRESSYTGLMAFDPDDPETVYISTDVDPSTGKDLGGVHEIYSARIKLQDDTSTIQWQPVTSGSPHRNIRPILISGKGYKVVIWLSGPWNTFTDYASDVVGLILERPN